MKTISLRSWLLAFLSLAALSSMAAPSFTLAPASVTSDAFTVITYTIGGLAPGEAVVVERFADLNSNGAIDAGEPLIRRFRVTDGAAPSIGGVRNRNVPGDDDGTQNGAIRVDLPFPGAQKVTGRITGRFLVRISGASGEALQPFEVTQPVLPQRITGVVRNQTTGDPIPYAFVVLVTDNGPAMNGVIADSAGAYTFFEPPGRYLLFASSGNFVGSGNAGRLSLAPDQTLAHDVLLIPASAQVGGQLTDRADGTPLPSIVIIAQTETPTDFLLSFSLTDASGRFQLGATPGGWEIEAEESTPQELGYLADQGAFIHVGNAPVTQNLTLQKANALIYGRVRRSTGEPLPGLGMSAEGTFSDNESAMSRSLTADGQYFLAVRSGSWEIEPEDIELIGLRLRPDRREVTLTANQALVVDFSFAPTTAVVAGRVVDDAGQPVAGQRFRGMYQDARDPTISQNTGPNGEFELPVWGGQWRFNLDRDSGFLSADLDLLIVDGVDRRDIVYAVLRPTQQINGIVRTSTGQAVAGASVIGRGNANGSEYWVSTDTDPNGAFSLNVANGTWQVWVECGDLQQRGFECLSAVTQSVNNNNPNITFTVSAPIVTAHLRGRATDNAGNPMPNIRIGAWSGPNPGREVTTNQNGEFDLGVTAGQWLVQINGPNPPGFIGPSFQFQVQDGFDVNGINFRMLPVTRTISGFVRTSSGTALAGISIDTRGYLNNVEYYANSGTDSQGFYSLAVFDATWRLSLNCNEIELRGLICPNSALVAVAGGNATRDITVQPVNVTAHLRGRAVDHQGNPVANLQLLANQQGPGVRQTTGPNGEFDIGVTAAGRWYLQTSSAPPPGWIAPFLQFDVFSGVDVNNIEFRLLPVTGTIRGLVRNAEGQPLANVWVYAGAAFGSIPYFTWFDTFSAADGSFDLSAAIGEWRLYFDCSDLESRGYVCPNNLSYTVTANSPRADIILARLLGTSMENPRYISAGPAQTFFQFTLRGAPASYDLYESDTLAQGSWRSSGISVTIAAGQSTIDVSLAASNQTRFYRALRR